MTEAGSLAGAAGPAAGSGVAAAAPPAPSPPPFLAACRCLPVAHTPIWLMRQAGRYLPEYRALRERHAFLALMRTPELAAEVTLQPVRRFAVDAAILFADIMTPLDGLGLGLEFAPGPVLARPVRTAVAVDALRLPDLDETVPYVTATIRALSAELPAQAPLIGFAGAPFTLFCYLVEGQASKSFATARSFLYREPATAARLLDWLADLTIAYLTAQARAGTRALMVFDSWAGLLGPDEFRRVAMPVMRKVFDALGPLGLPRIYFPYQGATLLASAATLPVEVIGIDWRTPLGEARETLGPGIAVQGNLDPAALFAPDRELVWQADQVLDAAGPAPGHVFNLGHGVEPATDPAKVARLVEHVHRRTEQRQHRVTA